MREALTTLPWVEPDSIVTDLPSRQAKFTLKDRTKFDMEELKRALGSRYAERAKVMTGPTEQ